MKRIVILLLAVATMVATGCAELANTTSVQGSQNDTKTTIAIADELQARQATPDDFDYSLERYNLIRRAYWVNGQRDRARIYPSPIADMPLGYVVLFTGSGAVVGRFVVEGKVTSLNSYLTPDSEYYELIPNGNMMSRNYNKWLADVDGSYGENDSGIFFFTPDGKYVEWTGTYLYSDIPFEISDPIVRIGG